MFIACEVCATEFEIGRPYLRERCPKCFAVYGWEEGYVVSRKVVDLLAKIAYRAIGEEELTKRIREADNA